MSSLVLATTLHALVTQTVVKVTTGIFTISSSSLLDCTARLTFQSVTNQSYYLFVGSNTNDLAATIGSLELTYYDSSCTNDQDCVDESNMCDTAQCLVGTSELLNRANQLLIDMIGRCQYQEVVCPPATGACNVSTCDPYSGCVYSIDSECTPYKIDCCQHNLYSPGCTNSQIEQCVCAIDNRCCNEAWFSICIQIASDNCQAPCFATDSPTSIPNVPITDVPSSSPSAEISQTPTEDRSQGVIIALSILVAIFGLLAIIGLIVIIVQRRALGRRYQNADPLLMNYNWSFRS